MNNENTSIGSIHISPRAIATIAYQAAIESYGVVGLASKNIFSGISQAIVKDPTHGVEVAYDGNQIDIDIYIIIEYGTRISSVAESVKNTIQYHVEKVLEIPVHSVNVHVRGLRISNVD